MAGSPTTLLHNFIHDNPPAQETLLGMQAAGNQLVKSAEGSTKKQKIPPEASAQRDKVSLFAKVAGMFGLRKGSTTAAPALTTGTPTAFVPEKPEITDPTHQKAVHKAGANMIKAGTQLETNTSVAGPGLQGSGKTNTNDKDDKAR